MNGKNLIDCGYSEESIKKAISQQVSSKGDLKSEYLYGSGNSANEVADILANTNIENTQKLNSY